MWFLNFLKKAETDQKYAETDQKFEETDQQNEIFKLFLKKRKSNFLSSFSYEEKEENLLGGEGGEGGEESFSPFSS